MNSKKIFEVHKIYAILALVFGMIFVFATPPFQSPDEDSHFKKSYQISRGHFYPSAEADGAPADAFPTAMLDYIDKKLSFIGDYDAKYSYEEMSVEQYSEAIDTGTEIATYSTANTMPLVYIAPATGILAAKISGKILGISSASPVLMLYFARVFSLIASVILISIAIKLTPIFKRTMCAIGLMPMTLFLCSMVSYDNILISLSLMLFAIIFKIYFDREKITKKDIALICTIGVVLFSIKTIYAAFLLLLFFISWQKFGSKKQKFIMAGATAAFIIMVAFLFKLPTLFQSTSAPADQLVSSQIQYGLDNPLSAAKVITKNIFSQRFFQFSSMVGVLGLLDTYLPLPIIILSFGLVIFSAVTDSLSDKKKLPLGMIILSPLLSCICVFAVFAAMYFMWTPQVLGEVGGETVSGVQGRYMIPLIFPVILSLAGLKAKKTGWWQSRYANVVYYMFIAMPLTISVMALVFRFWVS